MYQNIYIEKSQHGKPTVHLWDDKLGYQKFQFTPYAYQKSPTGQHRSLYGDKLKKVQYWTGEDLQEGNIFESDVPLETRVLIDKYGDSNEPSEGHRELFFDIECEIGGALTEDYIANAPMPITSIAYWDKTPDQWVILILDNKSQLNRTKAKNKEIFPCKTEQELLARFLEHIRDIDPDILIGYNSDYFDIPYLYHRMCSVLVS